ncbi:hypothetical protein C8R44DRAFT_791531 [Mycena epipterygia]|nr:hypothetical protein C8R44DRAFT_791531 [Mycena epipterygia]
MPDSITVTFHTGILTLQLLYILNLVTYATPPHRRLSGSFARFVVVADLAGYLQVLRWCRVNEDGIMRTYRWSQ